MNTPATQAAEQRLQALAWLKTHYPELVDAYWHGDIGAVRAGMLRLVESLQAIHDEVVTPANYPAREEYWETGNPDDAYEEGQRSEAEDIFALFGCTCQPKEDQ